MESKAKNLNPDELWALGNNLLLLFLLNENSNKITSNIIIPYKSSIIREVFFVLDDN